MSLGGHIAHQARQPNGLFGRVVFWIMSHETRRANAAGIAHLSLRPGHRVLEVGFGHGRTLAALLEAVPNGQVTGVDFSADAVQWAEHKYAAAIRTGRLRLHCCDDVDMPLPDASVDRALSVHTVYFWKNPLEHLRSFARVLAPDGLLVLGWRVPTERSSRFPDDVYRFPSAESIQQLAQQAGFSDIRFAPSHDPSKAFFWLVAAKDGGRYSSPART
jgi:ubiquinone/menaquinone biosynthesis C-methylase UbiE